MSRGVARLGDITMGNCRCGHPGQIKGKIITSSPDTNANGRGVARLGDMVLAECGHTGKIVSASADTNANGRGVARLGDKTFGCYVATIISASPDVNCN